MDDGEIADIDAELHRRRAVEHRERAGAEIPLSLLAINVTTAPVVVPVETNASTGGASDQKAKLPSAQKIALKALENALGDEGKVPPANNSIPSKTATVSVETWRRYAYK